ncbi:MAG: flagellar biosynthesis protein FlhF, partial [Planctomycetota bacterium]
IDTAGRSHRDERRMDELGRVLEAARADEVHLVLSLAAERQSLFSAIDRFTPLGANRIILTKLDEAERAGAVLQASARARLPASYVTTGQEVPDDIEVADSARLARLVLDGPSALRRAGRAEPMRRSA